MAGWQPPPIVAISYLSVVVSKLLYAGGIRVLAKICQGRADFATKDMVRVTK
jgi:hypothetical protein